MSMRKALNRETVVDAAFGLAAAEGVSALTLRRLAGQLGVSAPTLLWHVGSRQRLLIHVTDRVFASIPLPEAAAFEPLDWLRLAATAIRGALRQQPLLIPLVRDLGNWSVAAIDVEVSILEALETAGFTDGLLLQGYACYAAFVYGYTFLEHSQTTAFSSAEPDVRASLEARVRWHSQRELPPTTARMLRREQPRPLRSEELDEHFASGLEALLSGLRASFLAADPLPTKGQAQ